MKSILTIFIIEEGDNKAFAMADFVRVYDKSRGYIFLLFDEENNKWVVENNWKNPLLYSVVIIY